MEISIKDLVELIAAVPGSIMPSASVIPAMMLAVPMPAQVPAVERVLFTEGTTLGVRRHKVERTELVRRFVSLETPHGPVRLKIGELAGEVVHVAPEYEECRELAQRAGVPLREVIRAAMAQWQG